MLNRTNKTMIYKICFYISFLLVVKVNYSKIVDTTDQGSIQTSFARICCNTTNAGKIFLSDDSSDTIKIMFCPSTIARECYKSPCSQIIKKNLTSLSGYYNYKQPGGNTMHVYCNMEDIICGSQGGWTRVGYLNMSDPSEDCPSGFRLREFDGIRACARPHTSDGSCASIQFLTNDSIYSQVCGRIRAYQKGSTDAVDEKWGSGAKDINSYYVDCVSLTYGSPRKHLWTFMAALQENSLYLNDHSFQCPCFNNTVLQPQIPEFVGNDYFCESGCSGQWNFGNIYASDPLWDGKQCGKLEKECCENSSLPWFHKVLPSPTNEPIELRICCDQSSSDEDVLIECFEIFVK